MSIGAIVIEALIWGFWILVIFLSVIDCTNARNGTTPTPKPRKLMDTPEADYWMYSFLRKNHKDDKKP